MADTRLGELMHKNLPRTGFLDLPKNVREKIYRFSGLIKTYLIQTVTEYKREEKRRGYALPVRMGTTAKALLLASRAIYKDVVPLFYSENSFGVFFDENQELLLLPGLTSNDNLRHVTTMLIGISICEQQTYSGHSYPGFYAMANGSVLNSSRKGLRGINTIRKWRILVEQLQEAICPGVLRLTILCDVSDLQTAKDIVRPMQTLKLKDCTLCFGPGPDDALRTLARETVLRVTGKGALVQQTIDFLQFPKEIQLQILGHTALNCRDELWVLSKNPRGIFIGNRSQTRITRCRHSFEINSWLIKCAGFSSEPCNCWSHPAGLFRICRDLHEDAIRIFYGNSFRLCLSGAKSVDLAKFLTLIPSYALKFLREIRVQFGTVDIDDVNFAMESYNQPSWKQGVEILLKEVNLELFTLRIANRSYNVTVVPKPYTAEERALIEEREWILFEKLTNPLMELRGRLRDFSIHMWCRREGREFSRRSSLQMEREVELERRIMGPEYDAYAHGKE